jgi:cytochrome P450
MNDRACADDGNVVVSTAEPENIKTMLALKFTDYTAARQRKVLLPILGLGIFTADGAAWEHSRAMLRPNFVTSQLRDLNMFEVHVAELIRAIPADGSTLDLQDLFFDLTLDSATEFLFGESAGCLPTRTGSRPKNSFGPALTTV